MTGTLRIIKNHYYISLSYKDPKTKKWKTKSVSTGLSAKNNKRKAENLISEAIQKYAYLENEKDDIVSNDILFYQYLENWLHDKEIELRKSTYETYTYRVNRMIEYWTQHGIKLKDITPKILDDYFKYLLRYGKVNQKTHNREPLSARSVRDYRSILYGVFNQAVIDGHLTTNPITATKIRGKKKQNDYESYLFLTEDEISKLLHFLAEYNPRLMPIAYMGIYFGLRRSEILGLKWDAIDWENKLIHINHTVVRVKTISASDTTKSFSSKRNLALFNNAERCLKSVYEAQMEHKAYFGSSYKNIDNYVFTWEDGSSYDPDYISKAFSKATKAFGRPEITIHKLRHSCASLLFSKNWNIKQVQYWLGHSDAQTTLNIYTHYDKQKINSTHDDLADISQASSDLF